MRDRVLRPSNVNKCEDCDCDYVSKKNDGLTVEYYCWKCRDLLADLMLGSEP